MNGLKYEEPSLKRKEQAINFIKEFIDNNSKINGVGGLDRFINDYENWLIKLKEDKVSPITDQRVPAVTYFLIREEDDKIIGMANIRLSLNDALKAKNGNIGYCIRPTERRKGYNKINLYFALEELKKYNNSEALITCYKDNLGSSKTIKALGGVLQKEEILENKILQFYLIDIDKSLKDFEHVIK